MTGVGLVFCKSSVHVSSVIRNIFFRVCACVQSLVKRSVMITCSLFFIFDSIFMLYSVCFSNKH